LLTQRRGVREEKSRGKNRMIKITLRSPRLCVKYKV
jgi:hypothetical protein